MTRHALAQLHQRMLDVTRLLPIVEVLVQLLVGELPSEPGVPPEQERHEDDQPAGGEEKNLLFP